MEPFGPPKQNLRGMNKPKCIQCGNVARSRCPFQSCKGCCSKAQNPCHIHVLKQSSSTLPDKPPPSAFLLPEQPSTDAHSKGSSSVRLSSLRQLSSNLANTLRSKRPLSRKDAINVNKWRFSKLREHVEEEIQTENEAFDRYMQNVGLLEETLSLKSTIEGTAKNGVPGPVFKEKGHETLISAAKTKMRCSSKRSQGNLERTQTLVDTLLRELRGRDEKDKVQQQANGEDDSEVKRRKKALILWAEKSAAAQDLLDRLIKVRTDDDLRSCVEMKRKLYDEHAKIGSRVDGSAAPVATGAGEGSEASEHSQTSFSFSLPKLWASVPVKQSDTSIIEEQLSSLGDMIRL